MLKNQQEEEELWQSNDLLSLEATGHSIFDPVEDTTREAVTQNSFNWRSTARGIIKQAKFQRTEVTDVGGNVLTQREDAATADELNRVVHTHNQKV